MRVFYVSILIISYTTERAELYIFLKYIFFFRDFSLRFDLISFETPIGSHLQGHFQVVSHWNHWVLNSISDEWFSLTKIIKYGCKYLWWLKLFPLDPVDKNFELIFFLCEKFVASSQLFLEAFLCLLNCIEIKKNFIQCSSMSCTHGSHLNSMNSKKIIYACTLVNYSSIDDLYELFILFLCMKISKKKNKIFPTKR